MRINNTFAMVGASAAGIAAVRALHEADPHAEIVCISDQSELPYNTCLLVDYLVDRRNKESISIVSQDLFNKPTIKFLLGKRVTRIDRQGHTIVLNDGRSISYKKLLLATGSSAFVPSIQGLTQVPYFVFHTLADVERMKNFITLQSPKSAVVIGAGLTGLECANAFLSTGLQVTVLEKSAHIARGILDADGAQFLQQQMENQAITIKTGAKVDRVEKRAEGVMLKVDTGEHFFADMIVIACGMRPASALAIEAGLMVDGGIITNEYLQTSDPAIYAAGDVALVKDLVTEQFVRNTLWPDAVQQGLLAGRNMLSEVPQPYGGVLKTACSTIAGLPIVACGAVALPGAQVIIRREIGYYHRFLLVDNQLKGFCMIGNLWQVGSLRSAILRGIRVTEQDLGF